MKPDDFLKGIPLEDDNIETVIFSDVESSGTALEVWIGEKLIIEFVVTENAERQVILYPHESIHRLTLERLDQIVQSAKNNVRYFPDYVDGTEE